MSRLMGLDVGSHTVGVALSDPGRIIANGLTTLRRGSMSQDLDQLVAWIAEYEVTEIVVGWPLHLSGRMSATAKRVEVFIEALAQRVTLPIHRVDERMTTVMAERALIEGGLRRHQRKGVIDKVAATLILQGYIDQRAGA
ncbi:Holliday junction resolvase RuvX [Myxococcota bacterium]|nr:Holliday junction resolvase RuvX [Myxococcota bacterium]MBU1431101.1 Holliday junction resolvase RuvX [Myxococcota bacterium]MBU1899896.1 Holliday junction resolvase RuvX [Myxococcota bacterium]